jgi:lincosamide nucleotidyltransferase A/C/D/E
MRSADVLWFLDALDTAGVPCWVVGGWGVDALAGRQARKHHDLDLVLLDFELDEPQARRALGPLGFRRIHHSQASSILMPMRSLLDDDAGRQIDLVNIDGEQLLAGLSRMRSGGSVSSVDAASAFSTGEIGGRQVA